MHNAVPSFLNIFQNGALKAKLQEKDAQLALHGYVVVMSLGVGNVLMWRFRQEKERWKRQEQKLRRYVFQLVRHVLLLLAVKWIRCVSLWTD